MALNVKLETVIEIKSPAEKFYKAFRNEKHLVATSCDKVPAGIDLHEGDWEGVNSIRNWTYILDGYDEVFKCKERIEEVDEANMIIKHRVYGGEIDKHYKSFKPTIQVIPKGQGGLVKWTLEFEKIKEDVHAPEAYLGFVTYMTKDLDAHLLKA